MTERSVLIVSMVFFTILNAVRCLNEKIAIDETSVKPLVNDELKINDMDWQDVEKRASMGFHGMRGKKYDEEVLDYEGVPQWYNKRASMGFHGMRGKKEYYEPFESESSDYDTWGKRASMGFNGMRGKKSTDKKASAMGFNGMRGKKSNGNDFLNDIFMAESNGDMYGKRASMGFNGMRGKKSDESDWAEWEKRASMGFHGMRGKKDGEPKRAMGFQGMRGKKNVIDIGSNIGLKGATEPGYFGVRGKQFDDNEEEINTLLTYLRESEPRLNNESSTPLDRARRAAFWARNSKKARTAAFFGMRGKKSWIIGNDLQTNL